MMDISEKTRRRIDLLCNERSLSINKLAAISGIPQSTLSDFIHGSTKNMRIDTIEKTCRALEISLKDFFDDPIFDENKDTEKTLYLVRFDEETGLPFSVLDMTGIEIMMQSMDLYEDSHQFLMDEYGDHEIVEAADEKQAAYKALGKRIFIV